MSRDPLAILERADERDRDEQARAIFERYSTHIARRAALNLINETPAAKKDLEERLLDLEAGQEIEKAARYYLWDLTTLEQRQRWIAVRTQEMNKERPHAGTVWARRVQKRARQLAMKSARLEP